MRKVLAQIDWKSFLYKALYNKLPSLSLGLGFLVGIKPRLIVNFSDKSTSK